jgi:hypothetical protein
MGEDIKFIDHEEYLEVIFTGERSFQAFDDLLEKVYESCKRNGTTKILLDVREAKGKWKDVDRFRVGEKAAHLFVASYVILVIDEKEQINKLAENTAYNRGVKTLVTDDKRAGLDWLLKGFRS